MLNRWKVGASLLACPGVRLAGLGGSSANSLSARLPKARVSQLPAYRGAVLASATGPGKDPLSLSCLGLLQSKFLDLQPFNNDRKTTNEEILFLT